MISDQRHGASFFIAAQMGAMDHGSTCSVGYQAGPAATLGGSGTAVAPSVRPISLLPTSRPRLAPP
ncbi:hypothetical protein [Mycobacterium simiae]|uniref:hypothetical protein n=1 Tax=Mycobacterium simiae TaxID=1784 RepID=UPI0011F3CBCF|nr:hypothetical protein [Mycobacterium simiae]